MMKVINGNEGLQGTEEWLSLRRTRVTASEVSAAVGLSPWVTPQELFEVKTGKRIIDNSSKQFIFNRGKELEIVARNKYSKEVGKIFETPVISNDKWPFALASLDGISSDNEVIEIKHLGVNDFLDVALGLKIPEKYIPQVQMQIALCEIEELTFIGINSKEEIAVFKVIRNSDYIEWMMEEAKSFWHKVQKNEPIEGEK